MRLISFVILILISFSCNKIDNPLTETPDSGECLEPIFPVNTNTKRNILIEDFTGHNCNNCPRAAYNIELAKTTFGDQIIPVAIHVTQQFAGPVTNKAPNFQTDFRTTGGTNIHNNFIPTTVGLPAIMISRIDSFTTPKQFNLSDFSLTSYLNRIINSSPYINMQIIANYDEIDNKVCAFSEVEVLQPLSDDHSIVFMLLEDSIIDWQIYNGNGGDPAYSRGDIPNYVHKHVLRKSMNGWEGKKILTASNVIGDKVVEGIEMNNINSDWRKNHLEVIAFVYNNRTKEIMQVCKAKL